MEANICKAGNKGKPPLSWAVINEDADTVEFLLENGAESTIQLALMEAVDLGSDEMVRFLKEKGAFVDLVKKYKDIVLDKAAKNDNLEIVKYVQECDVARDEGFPLTDSES
jgi:ankyrin repeat protein